MEIDLEKLRPEIEREALIIFKQRERLGIQDTAERDWEVAQRRVIKRYLDKKICQ